mmetsp:Transcript_7042/g.11347  ORF Transcript_7042/g.11347 Transcript_7042/m.11347 type:complete len:219 (-) Transcript_7042:85-741(-)
MPFKTFARVLIPLGLLGFENQASGSSLRASETRRKVDAGKADSLQLNSAKAESELEHAVAMQSLRNRLSSTRSHLQDMVLRIEDYTNKVEMGIRDKPSWTPADAEELGQRLAKPQHRVDVALVSIKADLQDSRVLNKAAIAGAQQTLKDAAQSVAAAKSIVESIRKADAKTALIQLSTIRDSVDRLDAVLQSSFPAPKKGARSLHLFKKSTPFRLRLV